jgi:hypothetical protein
MKIHGSDAHILYTRERGRGKISLQGSNADILSKGRDTKAIETDTVFSTRSGSYIFLVGEGYLETDILCKVRYIFSARGGIFGNRYSFQGSDTDTDIRGEGYQK